MLALLWLVRNGSWRPLFFAMAYFVVSLFPVLEFFQRLFLPVLVCRGSFSISREHWATRAGGGGHCLGDRVPEGAGRASCIPFCRGAAAGAAGALTFLQCGVYYNLETLWRITLADNPKAWIAHFNLADILVRQGHLDEAADALPAQLAAGPDERGRPRKSCEYPDDAGAN